MKRNLTPIASGVALFLMGVAMSAQAQQADEPVQTVVTTGIRAALQQSMNQKRKSASNVEVVTAEDVGKMPDKNVADTLQRVPGVMTTAGGAAGSLGENEKVSIRGTADNLTLTTLNGHSVASADWFWADIVGSGRSVSYSLLPSELIGRIVVHKASEASLPEGGVSGTVDIEARHPLDFKKQLNFAGSIGYARQNYAASNDPQISGLVAWKNDANTVGVLVQAFSQKRELKREEFENVWKLYEDTSWAGNTNAALSAAGVDLTQPHRYAPLNGSAVFEQDRKRKGGYLSVQLKPTDALSMQIDAFDSKMDAGNYNINWMQDNVAMLSQGIVPTKATVENGVITNLQFDGTCTIAPSLGLTATQQAGRCAAAHANAVDLAARPDAYTKTDFVNLDATYKVSNELSFSTKLGETKSEGHSQDYAIEIWGPLAASGYQINGPAEAFTITFPSSTTFANGNNAANAALRTAAGMGTEDEVQGWSNIMDTRDKEKYLHLDGVWKMDGTFNALKFGARFTDHTRDRSWIVGAKTAAGKLASSLPTAGTYTGFGSGLPGGALSDFWVYTPEQIKAYGDQYITFDPKDQDWSQAFDFQEKTSAAYVQGDFAFDNVSGNIGLRAVKTKDDVNQFQVDNAHGTYQTLLKSTDFYAPWNTSVEFTHLLPSANARIEITKELVARVAASRTEAHPDFGKFAGLNLNDTTLSGTGANPTLAPTRSNNLEAGLEWYFAPRSLLAATAFTQYLQGYVTYGESKANFYNSLDQKVETYTIGGPAATDARVHGFELVYDQALGGGFGLDTNYTYAQGSESNGGIKGSLCAGDAFLNVKDCNLFGTSKETYNVGVYFENETFNARLGYSKRAPYLFGTQPSKSVYVDNGENVSASFNYNITQNLILSLEGQNLTNPVMSTTSARTHDQVDVGHQGRTYFVTLRAKY